MTPGTIHLHRVLRTTPEKVYRAFLDRDALARWLPPHGFLCTVHTLEARVGGSHRASFTNFGTGASHSFGGTYQELVPGQKLVYTDRFDAPGPPGEMTVTVLLRPVMCGTDVTITPAGIPAVIPVEMCYLGWQESLGQLANLVEPDIKDG